MPVCEASAAMDSWRERTCRDKPSRGVPAHVTLVFPFVPAPELDAAGVAALRAVTRGVVRFHFELIDRAEAAVRPLLPIRSEPTEALLLEEVEPGWARWRPRARLPLGGGGDGP